MGTNQQLKHLKLKIIFEIIYFIQFVSKPNDPVSLQLRTIRKRFYININTLHCYVFLHLHYFNLGKYIKFDICVVFRCNKLTRWNIYTNKQTYS